MFIMYVVDVTKPTTGPDAQSPPTPPQSDYPTPPPNAIPCSTNGSQIPIYYNQTVVLQCLTSGVVSPVLIIRKVDHATTVVGGGLQDGAKGVPDHYCVNGEVCGDPVSQLHKIALEVYEADKGVPEGASDPGSSGSFLSCMGEKVNTHRPGESRQWNGFFSGHHHMQTGSSSPSLPGSPVSITPPEYGMPHLSSGSNSPTSPTFGSDYTDIKTGSIRRKRNSLNNGGVVKSSRESSTSSQSKTRRRVNSAGSSGSNGRGAASAGGEHSTASGALWSIDIGETAVWTVVGTGSSFLSLLPLNSIPTNTIISDQIRYNFYVPPILFDNPPSLLKPVTPFPGVVKYLPPDRAAEAPKAHHTSRTMTASNPIAAKLLTVYGENFNKVYSA
jgi:recombining binding protein (suppressor of hairless)